MKSLMNIVCICYFLLYLPHCKASETSITKSGFENRIKELVLSLDAVPFDTELYKSDIGQILQVPISHIHPGQHRYSFASIIGRIEKMSQTTNIEPYAKPLRGVLTNEGVVLLDGHHTVLMHSFFNQRTFPIEIIDDLTEANNPWNILMKKNLVYLKTLDQKLLPPPRWMYELKDDLNRYFVSVINMNIDYYPRKGMVFEPAIKTDYPVWIKVNESLPFIEFYLADLLYESGFLYQGNAISDDSVEYTRHLFSGMRDKIKIDLIDQRKSFIELRKKYRKINLPESTIKATCLKELFANE